MMRPAFDSPKGFCVCVNEPNVTGADVIAGSPNCPCKNGSTGLTPNPDGLLSLWVFVTLYVSQRSVML